MEQGYTENPHNISEIMPYVVTDKALVISKFFEKEHCYFYDTCSFRRHSQLELKDIHSFFEYIKDKNGIIVITRCILMELASHSGVLQEEYIQYMKNVHESGICALLIYEEDIFHIMNVAFSTNQAVNEYLCWAVRSIKNPVSTIAKVINSYKDIENQVKKGKNLDNKNIFSAFFQTVRKEKEAQDNLGEEILAICLHMLSHLPGEEDGKFCIITDDKGAAGKINTLFEKTAKQHRGKKIIIFSTPKLVQILYREHYIEEHKAIKNFLEAGTEGNIVVIGTLIYDIYAKELSFNSEELAELIRKPNGIQISY